MRIFTISLLLFCGVLAFSQDKPNNFITLLHLEAKAHYGFVIPHHPEIWALTDGYFPLWEVSIFKQTDGRKSYHYLRRYPQPGLTYFYTDFGRSQELGVMHAVIPNIRIPLIKKEKFSLAFGIGLGAAYLSKKFDRLENYKNLTIGSHYNAAVNFQLRLRWRLSTQLHFVSGASMLHVSNGTIKTPNYGLNIPALFAGFDLKLNRKKINYIVPNEIRQLKKKINLRLGAGIATKETGDVLDKQFKVYIGNLTLSRFYNNTNRFLIGVDGVYDESTKYTLETKMKPTEEYLDVMKIGINIGHEWTFSRLSMFMNLGYYVHNNNDADESLYNKLGMTFNFLKFAYAGVTLQAHWAKAEFLSFGIGFIL